MGSGIVQILGVGLSGLELGKQRRFQFHKSWRDPFGLQGVEYRPDSRVGHHDARVPLNGLDLFAAFEIEVLAMFGKDRIHAGLDYDLLLGDTGDFIHLGDEARKPKVHRTHGDVDHRALARIAHQHPTAPVDKAALARRFSIFNLSVTRHTVV